LAQINLNGGHGYEQIMQSFKELIVMVATIVSFIKHGFSTVFQQTEKPLK
jgi:hypothetical protein